MDKRSEFGNLVGPVIHYYLLRLGHYLDYLDDGKTKFLFVSRAGIRIQKLYKIYLEAMGKVPGEHTELFWTSRFVLCKAFWTKHWNIVGEYVYKEFRNQNAEDFVRALFKSEDPSQLSAIDLSKQRSMNSREFIDRINLDSSGAKGIHKYLSGQEEIYKAYLQDLIGDYQRVVLVDSGWQGTIYNILSQVYPDKEWIGLLLGRLKNTATPIKNPANLIGVLFENDISKGFSRMVKHQPATSISLNRHLIESLVEPNAPSVEAIELNAETQKYVPRHIDELLNEELSEETDYDFLGVCDYLSANAGKSSAGMVYQKYSHAIGKLKQRLCYPDESDIQLLGDRFRSADFGKDLLVPLLFREGSRFNGDTPELRIKNALWEQGQAVIEFKGPRRTEAQTKSFVEIDPRTLKIAEARKMSATEKPKVAIITRTRNRPILLKRAAESVARQKFQNFDWIVVNDGGERLDVDQVLLQSEADMRRIKIVHNEVNIGMEAASNRGISQSDAKYIVIHDDDDSWEPGFLSTVLEFLEGKDGNKYGGVITDSTYVSEEIIEDEIHVRKRLPYNGWIQNVSLMEMACGNIFPPIAFVYNREIYNRIGGYSEDLPVLGDWDFNLKFLQISDIGVLKEALANYHHRDINRTPGDYSNSVVGGVQKHIEYETIVRNRFLRDQLSGQKGDLGILVNLGYILRAIRGRVQTSQNYREYESLNQQIKWLRQQRDYFALAADLRWKSLSETFAPESNGNSKHPADFDEEAYLRGNPDVREAIAKGKIQSGFAHYVLFGRKEGRERPFVNKPESEISVELQGGMMGGRALLSMFVRKVFKRVFG